MKRLLLATAAVMALSAGAAMAADPPPSRRAPPLRAPAFVPFFTWTGLYAGILGGYGSGTSNWTNVAATTGNFNVDGALLGGTLGYNVQTGGTVFGLEADAAWSWIKGTTTTNCGAGCETSATWLTTVRGRIGYAFDRVLPYMTGGLAAGEIKAAAPGMTAASKTRIGWTVGGGIEYAFMGNWSAKGEYLYADLGDFDCSLACSAISPTYVSFKTHLLRVGLNYKF
ncbi:MAG: porin family protein [Alphaproteobacteria bacterium]|nr:porin family protein [Alphaproteobacteria bacterium]